MILSPKWPVHPNQVFFWKNHQINIHVPFDPFYSAKLQKKFLEWIHSYLIRKKKKSWHKISLEKKIVRKKISSLQNISSLFTNEFFCLVI